MGIKAGFAYIDCKKIKLSGTAAVIPGIAKAIKNAAGKQIVLLNVNLNNSITLDSVAVTFTPNSTTKYMGVIMLSSATAAALNPWKLEVTIANDQVTATTKTITVS